MTLPHVMKPRGYQNATSRDYSPFGNVGLCRSLMYSSSRPSITISCQKRSRSPSVKFCISDPLLMSGIGRVGTPSQIRHMRSCEWTASPLSSSSSMLILIFFMPGRLLVLGGQAYRIAIRFAEGGSVAGGPGQLHLVLDLVHDTVHLQHVRKVIGAVEHVRPASQRRAPLAQAGAWAP